MAIQADLTSKNETGYSLDGGVEHWHLQDLKISVYFVYSIKNPVIAGFLFALSKYAWP